MSSSDITADLYRRLRLRFGSQTTGHVLLQNVGDGAGHGNSGWSDAIAMQTWPSKGLRIFGFEVKASRSDWLRELDKPWKNSEWIACCSEWYLVALKGVCKDEELPDGWGLMVPSGADRLRITRRSEKECSPPSVELMAAVFRAAGNYESSRRREDRNAMRDEIRRDFEERIASAEESRQLALEEVRRLKTALGGSWRSIEDLEAVAAAVRDTSKEEVRRTAEKTLNLLRPIVNQLEAAAEAVGR